MSAVVGTAASPVPTAPRARLDNLHLTLAGLVLLLLWDLAGLDLSAMHLVADHSGFAWRDQVLTRVVLHEGGRELGWAALAALVVNVWRPLWAGPSRAERLRWLAVTVLCVLVVPTLKQFSLSSCPWDLAEFGGVARYVPHWQSIWGHVADGGPGRCFPSGHAAAAFAFIGGWFVLRPYQPRAARLWLMGVLVCGVLFGVGQFLRGAHYPSHTLWTAWLCWALSAALLQPRGDAPNRVSKPRV
ncbi:MAG: phosphatase PAP2 family protein [Rubrivivax sp.]|nr:phosphatase PAP2 family protein [Rubrivivax sp.]MBK7261341.1 phosphatase PAP2 family protein [Rubrivivax sp.]MBK8529600.1 phosphatase PAP2 family protein [Rubrivivax sp.]